MRNSGASQENSGRLKTEARVRLIVKSPTPCLTKIESGHFTFAARRHTKRDGVISSGVSAPEAVLSKPGITPPSISNHFRYGTRATRPPCLT